MIDKDTISVYDEKADEYISMVSRLTPDRSLSNFIDSIPTGGLVLDLGCGPGNSAKMMNDAGLIAEATDASPEMVKMAKEKFGINAEHKTFHDLDATNRYEGIWANFSLLHASKADFNIHLNSIHKALKPNGVLHLGLKTGTGERRDKLGRFYAYYSEDELKDLLNTALFDVETIVKGSEPGLAGNDEPFIIVSSRKLENG